MIHSPVFKGEVGETPEYKYTQIILWVYVNSDEEVPLEVLLEAVLDIIEYSPARQHRDISLESDAGFHVAESEAFVAGLGPIDLLLDAALSMVFVVGRALHQIYSVRLWARVGSKEHSGQRLLAEYVKVADSLAGLVHLAVLAAVEELVTCALGSTTTWLSGHRRRSLLLGNDDSSLRNSGSQTTSWFLNWSRPLGWSRPLDWTGYWCRLLDQLNLWNVGDHRVCLGFW